SRCTTTTGAWRYASGTQMATAYSCHGSRSYRSHLVAGRTAHVPRLAVFPNKRDTTPTDSATPNRGAVTLSSNRGSRHTSRGNVSVHSQEERHGPHNGILPQSALPCERPNRPGQYWYPCAEGAALPLPRVSHNLQRPHRDRLLPAAHLGRDRGARGDLARPWVPRASHRSSVWVRRAYRRSVVGPRGPSGPSRTRVSGRATTRPGTGAS